MLSINSVRRSKIEKTARNHRESMEKLKEVKAILQTIPPNSRVRLKADKSISQ